MSGSAAARRLAAFRTLTAILRGDPAARWPDDAEDWDALLGLAARHSLLPAVWSAWCDAGGRVVPLDVVDALEQRAPDGRSVPEVVLRRAYDASAARTERLLVVATDVLRRLDAAGIDAVPLKGLHMLLCGVWPDPAVRTMADLDVLVPADRATEAFALLGASYEEHPDAIGEHADHHLPMLRRDDVTIELHTELLVSRWSRLVPATEVLARARPRDTAHGRFRVASDNDTFVHLVAHAQLQDHTYRLLDAPLRSLFETAVWLGGPSEVVVDDVRRRFAAAGVGHVLDAHLHATHTWFGAPAHVGASLRAHAHTLAVETGIASPPALDAWGYVTRVPASFTAARMVDEFGPPDGMAWIWRARARHAARRVAVRVGRR